MIFSFGRYFSLPNGTYLLIGAQAVNLIAAVVSVTVAALVGSHLAPTPSWATLPYGSQFAAVMLATYPCSILMAKFGRRPIFMVSGVFLILAGCAGYFAVHSHSFGWLLAAHIAMGIYFAAANFYRFAAVDGLDSTIKARVISWVVSGGVLAAFIGPLAANLLRNVPGFTEFSLCYAFMVVLGVLVLFLLKFWKSPHLSMPITVSQPLVSLSGISVSYSVWVAIFSAAGGYFIMNLLMVQASMAMVDVCSADAAAFAIQGHVLAMFAPSFITGFLISRIGVVRVLLLGFGLILLTTFIGIQAQGYTSVLTSLIFLGIGWNFCYVGGGALLATKVADGKHHYWQGMNDTAVAACATLGAFLPAPLFYSLGMSGTNFAIMPICLLGMYLCLKVGSRSEVVNEPECAGESVR